ncbi:L,D-transpeptidase catalytic domain [Thiorhodovibrio winogradskyi]|uniref:L,D-transpeptidase catalytic domain n=1 Tax=Thiorhodovibrio winogradskyi TaxID=77007 RepID=A0ABZ0S6R6_9GAMM|nr:L,D-transpeptidase family protein [Thiorhodovibrio winogradskyi]
MAIGSAAIASIGFDRKSLLLDVLRLCLLSALLSGCTQSLPERAQQKAPDAEPEQSAEQSAATATTDPEAEDAPLPWPPPNGDIPQPQEAAAVGKMFEWHGDGRRVSRIVIDTDTQQARFFDGKELVGWSTVATGVSSHRTPTGEFSILEKVVNKRSNLYGRIYDGNGKLVKRNARAGSDAVPSGGRFVGAKMPHFMRMTYDGIGMHAGPIPRPGSPASHGCIRMPSQLADRLFKQVDAGTRVTVIGSQGPSYGNYAERVKAQQGEARAARAAAQARRDGDPLGALDAEIAALRGEDLPPPASSGDSEAASSPSSRGSEEETTGRRATRSTGDQPSDASGAAGTQETLEASGNAQPSGSESQNVQPASAQPVSAQTSSDQTSSAQPSNEEPPSVAPSGSDESAPGAEGSPASQAAGSVTPPSVPAT